MSGMLNAKREGQIKGEGGSYINVGTYVHERLGAQNSLFRTIPELASDIHIFDDLVDGPGTIQGRHDDAEATKGMGC
jgi:hypothetical protein